MLGGCVSCRASKTNIALISSRHSCMPDLRRGHQHFFVIIIHNHISHLNNLKFWGILLCGYVNTAESSL